MNKVSTIQNFLFGKLKNLGAVNISLIISLLVLPVAIFIIKIYFQDFLSVQYDDSYVTYRYANNLASGNGLRFNLGDNTNSASSLLFVLILAIGHFLTRIPIEVISTVINFCSLIVFLWSATYLVLKYLRNWRGIAFALILGLSISSYGPLIYWTISGMETTFFLALLSLSIVLALKIPDESERVFSKELLLVLGLLAITRVEGAVSGVVIGGLCFISTISSWKSTPRLRLLSPLIVPVGLFSLQLIFYRLYYGDFIADPIHFKENVRYYRRTPEVAWLTTKDFFSSTTLPFLVLVTVCGTFFAWSLIRKRHFQIKTALLPLLSLLLLLFILRSPHSDEHRYELVLFVPLVLATALIFAKLMSVTGRIQIVGSLLSVLIFGFLAISGGISEAREISSRTSTYMYVQKARAEAGKWLEENTPNGSRVVSADIGALSYFNPSNTYLDAAGLVNRDQLRTVLNSGDVYSSMKLQRPNYLADTVGPDGVSAVESILSNPLGYYIDGSGAFSSCPELPLFDKKIEKLLPETPPSILQIQVAKIDWINCG